MQKIPEQSKVDHFLVFFLIHSIQVGIGILGFQRSVSEKSGNDAWIAVIIGGLVTHIIVFMIYRILENSKGDLIQVHRMLFGKWLGHCLSLLFIFYFLLFSTTILRNYIEVVRVWIFRDMNQWLFSFVFLVLVYYVISGGFRTVVGVAVLGVVIPFYLYILQFAPLKFADFEQLLPVLDHSVSNILLSSKAMTLSLLGFELLLIYYPFIKNPEKSKKWAHLAVAFSTFIYTMFMIFSLVFFSHEQLGKNVWATLSMLKVVQFSFVERIEYIAISSWLFVILPNICIGLWAASRAGKRIFRIKQRHALLLALGIVFLANGLLTTRAETSEINDITSMVGFYIAYVYIPILFLISLLISKWKGRVKNE